MPVELSASWLPTQAEFDRFAQLSGDTNPIHVDPDYAARGGFGRTVSHGMLIYARLWALLHAAHPDARQLRQALMFPHPAFAGKALALSVTGEVPGRLVLSARRQADGAEVLRGEAEVA